MLVLCGLCWMNAVRELLLCRKEMVGVVLPCGKSESLFCGRGGGTSTSSVRRQRFAFALLVKEGGEILRCARMGMVLNARRGGEDVCL